MQGKRSAILYIFLIALLIRVVAVFVIHYGLTPELQLKVIPPDARGFKNAMDIANSWKTGSAHNLMAGTFPKYDYFRAAVYTIMGYHRVIVPLINAFIGALAVFMLYDLAKGLFNKRVALISSLLYTFFPSLIFWSTQNHKEILCIAIVVASVWAITRLQTPFRPHHLLVLAFVIPLLMELNELRGYIFIFLIYGIVLSFLVNMTKKACKKNIVYAIIFIILFYSVPQYVNAGIFSTIPRYLRDLTIRGVTYLMESDETKRGEIRRPAIDFFKDVETISDLRRGYSGGNALYGPRIDLSSEIEIIKFLPKGIFNFLFRPFFWECRGLLQKMTIPEMFLWYAIFLFGLIGSFVHRKNWKRFFLIYFFVAVTTAAYSLVIANFGTAYRYKATLLPFFFIFAAAGIVYLMSHIRERDGISSNAIDRI
ncbi:MAG: glycosyltransferase family 39 protein [Candidatus Omnitrophica bacterium]|nr:glycosyltransferase family 39 protein [Candidatus Omnitrophota bacterium]